MTTPHTLSYEFLKYSIEKLHFWVKSLKSELFQNRKTEKKFKYIANIRMYRGIMYIGFGDSSIKGVGELIGN